MFKQGTNSDGEPIRDVYVEHDPVDLDCSVDRSMTRQEFADECDINVLMATYERTGVVPSHVNSLPAAYLDVSDVPDLPKAIAIMDAAEAAFMTLTASVRAQFQNSAVLFVEFAQDPANLSQMRAWGLAAPAPVADEVSAPSAPPGPKDAKSSS